MSNKPGRRRPPGPDPREHPLRCLQCGTYRQLFISSVVPIWPVSEGALQVSYTCTACGLSYDHVADVSQFAGIANLAAGRDDVLIFMGEYIHCGQSMQHTASGEIRLDSPSSGAEDPGTRSVYLEIRVLECPCGFRLMLPR
jgi:DNA-directed RNA polymerase subunit RPC12/RpoP